VYERSDDVGNEADWVPAALLQSRDENQSATDGFALVGKEPISKGMNQSHDGFLVVGI
jgi:hypothetical protein